MLEGAFKYKIVFSRMTEENEAFQAYFLELEKDANKNLVNIVGTPGK